jgi:hypothetical protein
MEGTLEELRRISNCPEGATFSQLGLRKSVVAYPVHRRMIAERSRTQSRARRPRRQTDALTAGAIYENASLC